ncbi:DUF305 domain-containing protein [Nocardioides dubius]|uniref:DUF305 domain-containing protein n=1 Tax=Nocardioides dubius TaxID=317019 RepID=A0ABN1TSV5_9ACTN
MRLSVLLVTLTAVAALAGCGADEPEAPETVTLGGTQASVPTDAVQRPWGMASRPPALQKAQTPNAADVAFVRDMIPHHEQAIRMSALLLAHEGLDERVRASASYISSDQRLEIRTMRSWLKAWRDDLPPADPDHDHSTMPGMLAPAAVERLADLDPAEAQVEFLVLMQRHHRGAVTMSQDYLADAVNTYTLETARHVIREQQLENAYFTQVVDDLCGSGDLATCP